MTPSYVLVRDEDSHWYVIPSERESEFHVWAEGGYETEPEPDWAFRVGGAPSLIEFSNWQLKAGQQQ